MTAHHPALHTPVGAFDAGVRQLPTSDNPFILKLSIGGRPYGYLGENEQGWAVLVGTPDQARKLWCFVDGSYLHVVRNVDNRYMCVGSAGTVNNGYVGFWHIAPPLTGWAPGWYLNDNNNLLNSIANGGNGQALSLESRENGYLYAWDAYSKIQVEVHEVS